MNEKEIRDELRNYSDFMLAAIADGLVNNANSDEAQKIITVARDEVANRFINEVKKSHKREIIERGSEMSDWVKDVEI